MRVMLYLQYMMEPLVCPFRYKGIGRPVIDALVKGEVNGPFLSLKDFASRLSGKEVNKGL